MNKRVRRLLSRRRQDQPPPRGGVGEEIPVASPRRDEASTPPDVSSVRAKSQRHGKSTADKWNQ